MRLLIIRHADPEYADDSITAAGRAQAEALADRLRQAHRQARPRIAHIYSSPMGRARITAQITADALGLPVEVEAWTRELTHWSRGRDPTAPHARAGEGGPALWDTPGEQWRAQQGQQEDGSVENASSRSKTMAGVPESVQPEYQALQANSDAFLARHGYVRDSCGRYRVQASIASDHDGGGSSAVLPDRSAAVAVFCHGGFGLTWLAHLLQLPLMSFWCSFWLAPSSVTTVLFEQRSADFAVPRCLAMSDVGHLLAAGLPEAVPSRYERPDGRRPSGLKGNFY
ncbi:hypothetical protein CDCA_CDCA19G4723 [Cyanidium caldarium]|uniref:Phosphoglycerate mutase n=1 Tax=Cyanidium caldarium TaxID=2771 RepID=A0AAV9J3V9_CYACA|nr:hypothetical protein CDCA_CDCA19G4723 [Cyanidium caldarium]